jgi:hypothetical protein
MPNNYFKKKIKFGSKMIVFGTFDVKIKIFGYDD